MDDESIFDALQKAGIASTSVRYDEAKEEGWRTIDDLAELAECSRSRMTRLVESLVDAGGWERIKVKVSGGWLARAYREIEGLNE